MTRHAYRYPTSRKTVPHGVNFIDSQGAAKLAELHRFAATDGITRRLARLKPHVCTVLEADEIFRLIGTDHVHGNVERAVRTQLAHDDRLRDGSG